MSIKIYSGYTLKPDTNVFEFTEKLRGVLNPIRDRIDAEIIYGYAVMEFDSNLFSNNLDVELKTENELKRTVWNTGLSNYIKDQKNVNKNSYSYDPNRFEATFGRDERTGRILVITYCENKQLMDAWHSLPEVSEYGYWNNTDEPENVTSEEWDERGNVWDRVIGHNAPSEGMLSFVLRATSRPEPKIIDFLNPEISNHKKRGRGINAAQKLIQQAVELQNDVENKMLKDFIETNILKILLKIRKIVSEPGGFADQISEKIPDITLDLLNTSLKDLPTLDENILNQWKLDSKFYASEVLKKMMEKRKNEQ